MRFHIADLTRSPTEAMASNKPLPAPTEHTTFSPVSPGTSDSTATHVDDNVPYSTLEVHAGRFVEHDESAAPTVRPMSYSEKEKHFRPMSYSEKMTSYDNNAQKEIVVTETPVPERVAATPPPDAQPAAQPGILGMKRKTFFVVLAVALVTIVAAAVGGGVGAIPNRKDDSKPQASNSSTPTNTTTGARFANTGLAAMQWTDPNGTMHKRIYYQDKDNKVRESAWDNSTAFDTPWQINAISEASKPGTPIAAVAGWPHASYNYSLVSRYLLEHRVPTINDHVQVKNVYYMSTDNELVERQAQANNSQAWEDDNFTGLYSGSNDTFLSSYWCQNIANVSQELVVLFQQDNFKNGITQARYASANSSSNPWVENNFPFAQPKGANFAMSLVSYRSGKHLMLYGIGDNDKLGQYEYTISDGVDSTSLVSLTSQSATPLTIDARAPLAVVAQDNQALYTTTTLPECYQETPLTNLIFFATPDRSSLVMSAWNCTAGFEDHTAEIQPLQKANTTFLSLTAMSDRATGDGNVYIMFDSGKGPEVEEWTVPKRAGEPWTVSRKVDVDFAL